jgi:hypothetical protein
VHYVPRIVFTTWRGRVGVPDKGNNRMRLRSLVVTGAVAALALLATACNPTPPPKGEFAGPSYTGAGSPTGFKAEHKLWHHDGTWWSVMFDATAGDHYIFKLNKVNQTWTRTSTVLDTRSSAHADVLFDGTKLYVLSHVYSEVAQSGATTPVTLYRLSYSGGTWTMDTGFPRTVLRGQMESLTLTKDGTGRLWATWVEDAAVKYITSADGLTWSGRATLPGADASTLLTTDDISAIVAFNGRVGVLWSAQEPNGFGTTSFYFATHVDGAATTAWNTELVASAANLADDHISVLATSDGTVRAAVKTSIQTGTAPEIEMVTRTPAGSWSRVPVWRQSDDLTRPVLVIDATHAVAHVYATSPDGGGDIWRKSSPLSSPTFPVGMGELAIDDEAAGSQLNDATASKQVVTSATGLVVQASDNADRVYWHHWDPLS